MSEGSFFYRQHFIFTNHFVLEAPLGRVDVSAQIIEIIRKIIT